MTVLVDTLALLGINMTKRATVLGKTTSIKGRTPRSAGNIFASGSASGMYNGGMSVDESMTERRESETGQDRDQRVDEMGTRGKEMGSKPLGSSYHRTMALRMTAGNGGVERVMTAGDDSTPKALVRERKIKNDQYEATREIQMQNKQMQQTELQLRSLCTYMGIDSNQLMDEINSSLSVI
jgi:hypothetical protein